VIGAGVVGLCVAWHLQGLGHAVTLIDPDLGGAQAEGSGSTAALGLLMAQVYRRSSGRGWRLRQQSLELWQTWRRELEARGHLLPWRAGLLQLARDEQELQAQQRLAAERQARGIPLRLLERAELEALQPALPAGALGGLLSPNDGQIDPLPAMAALLADGQQQGMGALADRVERLERRPSRAGERWHVQLRSGAAPRFDWLVLTAGLASPMLLAPLGHLRPQTPVLGQALELQLSETSADPQGWPGSLSWGGVNLVPRPGRRLWLGATLEPERSTGAPETLAELRRLGGHAPAWLLEATVVRQWQGLRARPDGRPAPLLEQLEPGLLLASGHYRNGVLLAPASAAWVAEQISSQGAA
jgi:glycine/D-amino acid oxidase-like deaminating enzyme